MRLRFIYSFIILQFPVFLTSCGSGMKIQRASLKPVKPGFTATFTSQPIKKSGKTYLSEVSPETLTLVQLLDTVKSAPDSVQLSWQEDGRLTVSYPVDGGIRITGLKGRYHLRGYYEIMFRKKITNIPPLIGFIFSRRQVHRLRIAMTVSNELLVDYLFVYEGNVLIFGGGENARSQYWFRLVR